jgi:sulfatase maturation enzyme AslB (radical SAM superfamily)
MTQKDKVIYKLSQKEIMRSNTRDMLLNEISLLPAEKIMITGGEPFLNLGLSKLVVNAVYSKSLEIWTGLGVNTQRLINEIEKIKATPNISIVISAENIESYYEFNRYGNSYEKFLNNLEVIKQSGIPFKFAATVSNITLFGLSDFINVFGDYEIMFNTCNDPEFLSINVLDNDSKHNLIELLTNSKVKIPDIIKGMNVPCSHQQKQEAAIFIKEFASRRNLSLDIFPESFIEWINE